MQISTKICRWLFFLFFFSWASPSDSKDVRVVCYYTNWSVYRPGSAKFNPQNINPYLCTHLVYAFGGFTKENTLKPFDKYQDIEKGGYAKFTGLKTYNKELKTLLAIGGWNEASSRFSPMVASQDRRKQLVKNVIKFLRQNHFDGLDLDWEYPAFREGGKPRDKDNYASLVQELREEFDRESEKTGRPRLLLTMAVPAGIEYINKGYDIPKLTKYLDWMNILSYDYHSAFEPAVNHHAPLYSLEEDSEYNYDGELNIDYTIKHYLKLGADPNKLVMGIPTYGRSYTLFNPEANSLGSPADGPGDMGEATRENGYLAYYEICENIKSNEWEVVQPNENAMGPYAFKENQWVGYDDENIVRKKAEYVAKNGLGGIMFWAIDNDDFRGTCHGRPFPLIEAAKESLIAASGLTDENLIAPPSKSTKSKSRTEVATPENKKTSGAARRRNRLKSKVKDEIHSDNRSSSKGRRKDSKKTETSTYSSLKIVTPSYTTPEPPSTPDQGGAFKCEDEGFYPHPKDCKKYFWCLSGPGELGIVAHQFTCPAGLYFNKAADSCDYTQNVLCNKKLSKSTTTTTTTTTEAATTKKLSTKAYVTRATTRHTTTTTEEPEEEEYEYEEELDEEKSIDSEEDPKVIKELLELIKKAGGIEELEKQLKHYDETGSPLKESGLTTPSTRTKSLVERFLAKNSKNTANTGKTRYASVNRNSRGPQNEGLDKTNDSTKEKERAKPQYTNILRRRSSTPTPEETNKNNEDVESSGDEIKLNRPSTHKPEYVSIKRNRVSTTEKDNTVASNRNKFLGEVDEDKESENSNRKEVTFKPQYVNIRRQRPSTTTENIESNSSEDTKIKSSDSTGTSPKYQTIRRGSTSTENQKVAEETELSITNSPDSDELKNDVVEINTARYTTFIRQTTPLSSKQTEESAIKLINSENADTNEDLPETTLSNSVPSSTTPKPYAVSENIYDTKSTTPELMEPRPFTASSESQSPSSTPRSVRYTIKPITSTNKVSEQKRSRFRTNNNGGNVAQTSDNSVELNSQQNADQRSELNKQRVRGSRFKTKTTSQEENLIPSSTPSVRRRQRPIVENQLVVDKEEEFKRNYRPLVLEDLSSLTAADIDNPLYDIKNPRRNRQRITTSLKNNEKTESNKAINITPLRRRPTARKDDIRDQINSNTNDVTTKVFNELLESTSSPTRHHQRTRKILRRLRPTTPSPISISTSVRTRGKPFLETTLANDVGFTARTPRRKVDYVRNFESSEETFNEEDENFKLSESIRRENSKINNPLVDESKENFDENYGKYESFKKIEQYTTEPSFSLRTRKIIRKLPTAKPTETVLLEETPVRNINNFGRTRKIIRKLKPTASYDSSTSSLNLLDKSQENEYYPKFVEKSKKPTILLRYKSTTPSSIEKNYSFFKTEFNRTSENRGFRLNYSRFNTDKSEYDASSEISTETLPSSLSRGRFKFNDLAKTTLSLDSAEVTTQELDKDTSQTEIPTDEPMDLLKTDLTTILNDITETILFNTYMSEDGLVKDMITETNLPETTESSKTEYTTLPMEINEFTTLSNVPTKLLPVSTTKVISSTIEPTTNKLFRSKERRPKLNNKRIYRPSSTTESDKKEVTESLKRNRNRNLYRLRSTTPINKEKIETSTASIIEEKNRPKFKPRKIIKPLHLPKEELKSTTEKTNIEPLPKNTSFETNAINARNKHFSKKRKMNVPINLNIEKEKIESTTEYLTTLHHVFSEPEIKTHNNTITKNKTHINNKGKIEKLIEVNRIVEVHVKNKNKSEESEEETKSIIDKIGAITRITNINVVDGNNSENGLMSPELSSVQDIIKSEIQLNDSLNQKVDKFEAFVNGKIARNEENPEIIDGKSNIKVLTPRTAVESATISLEGLFNQDEEKVGSPAVADNELLDTETSRFVNIRILDQDRDRSLDTEMADSPKVAIRVLPNEEEVPMKAKIIEIKQPRHLAQKVKIRPIQVMMTRQIADSPILGIDKLNEKISHTPFRIQNGSDLST